MSWERTSLIFAIFIYTYCAIHSSGYYHYDEHFQIIEFAEFKAGKTSAKNLAWEYRAEIRSAIQPFTCYLIFSGLRSAGVTDNYQLIIYLRILTALFALSAITFFYKQTKQFIRPDLHFIYCLLSYFLWFLPFINVRFSSEELGGLFALLSFGVFFSEANFKYLLVGVLAGISFLFRFQTAFLFIGLVAYISLIGKFKVREILNFFLGFIIVLFAGFLIDCWFYNNIVFTFINYFEVNVINGVASKFGVSPWYSYFLTSIKALIYPIGIVVIISVLVYIYHFWKDVLAWSILSFLLIHIFIPHKELRFLFSIANFLPLIIMHSYQILSQRPKSNIMLHSKPFFSVCIVLFIINLLALSIIIYSPADNIGRINVAEYLHKNFHGRKIVLWTTSDSNPFQDNIPVTQTFYKDPNIQIRFLKDANLRPFDSKKLNLLAVRQKEFIYYDFLFYGLKPVYLTSGIPFWIVKVKELLHMGNRPLLLMQIPKPQSNNS